MRIALSIIAGFLLTITASAQTRTISKGEYERVFERAVSRTNAAFPFVFTVTTNFLANGKTIGTVTDRAERQTMLLERMTRTIVTGDRRTVNYKVSVAFGKVFCSEDGITWKLQTHDCWGPVSIYTKMPKGIKYSVTVKRVNKKKLRVYRAYFLLPPADRNEKPGFREKISTIDSRGFFKTVVDVEGTLNPRTVTLTRKQSWATNAKITPVVPPIN